MKLLTLPTRRYTHNTPLKQLITRTTSIASDTLATQDILTEDEKSRIDQLPFFLRSCNDTNGTANSTTTVMTKPTSKSKSLTRVEREYLTRKIASIRSVFGPDPEYPNYIAYTLQKPHLTPFQMHQKKKNRLAVTNLSTKAWCELRTAYDIYSGEEKLPTRNILYGTKFHKSLEKELHPVNQDMEAFIVSQGVQQDKHEVLAMSWWNTIQKFIDLFSRVGECREVLCHGYLRERDGWFFSQEMDIDQDFSFSSSSSFSSSPVLVSGIIDHLFWARSSECSKENPNFMKDCSSYDDDDMKKITGNFMIFDDIFMSQESRSDIATLIEGLRVALDQRGQDWEILVGDVKTRSSFTIPSHQSVIKATKLQIMYYRLFLQLLGKDPKFAYENLLLNAKIRGVDVDAPINPILILALMTISPVVIQDMRRLRDGNPIQMAQFDDFYASNAVSSSISYDTTHLSSKITSNVIQEKLKEFFQKTWKRPVTLRYFAARLAQFYNLVGSNISNKLLIEYYCDGQNFKNILFDYEEEILRLATYDSSLFWFGKRGIEPITPSLKNLLTYCKFCEYEDVCAWRKAGVEKSKQLGSDLANIYQDSEPK